MKKKDASYFIQVLIILFTVLVFGTNSFAQSGKDKWTKFGNITDPIRSIVVDPSDSTKIYISTDGSTIYKTTDGGYSWNGILINSLNTRIKKIVYDPTGSDKIIAITDSTSIWRNDHGSFLPTWSRIDTGLTDSVLYDIVINKDNYNILYLSTRSGVYKSTNQGSSWGHVNSGIGSDSTSIRALGVSTVNPNIVYAVSESGKVYRTENAGVYWTYRGAISGTPTATNVLIHPQYNNTLYVGTYSNGVYKSTDGGATFTSLSSGLLDTRILSLTIDTTNTDRIFAGTDARGVHKLDGSQMTWQPITTGLENGTILSLDVYENTPILIYAGTEVRGFFRYVENRRPVITPISDQRIIVGETLQFTVTATDADSGETEDLHFNIIGLPNNATFDSIGTRVFTWTPDTTQAGNDTIVFQVNDERDGFAYDTVAINVNNRPYIVAVGDTTIYEDSLLTVSLTVTDADGDVPTVSTSTILPSGQSTTLPTGASFSTGTNIFTWRPGYDQSGTYTITFTADDGRGATYSESIQITVYEVNQAPYFSPALTQQTVKEGQILNYTVNGVDDDEDDITYGVAGSLPSGAHFDSTDTKIFSWIPNYEQAGSYNIAFSLNDKRGGLTIDTMNIVVTDVNRYPVLSEINSPQYVNVGENLQFEVAATDADSLDSLTISVSGKPPGATFTSSGANKKTFSWTPSVVQYGTYNLTFNVQDESGDADYQDLTIIVNRKPVLIHPGNQSSSEGDTVSFSVNGSDADGDSLTFGISSDRPSGSTFSSSADSIYFRWITDYSSSGNYSVEFTVSDGRTGTDTITVNITITNVNRPPVLNAIGSKSGYVGSSLSFYIQGSDPDNDDITFSASNMPSGASFNSSTKLFSWTPQSSDVGTYYVTFKVTDSYSAVDSEDVSITVTADNRPPVFEPLLEDVTDAKEGQLVSFAVNGRDPDGDAITYGIRDSLPTGAKFDSVSTRKFTWVPSYSSNGNYQVVFKITDEHNAVAYDTVIITVADVNRDPNFSAMQDTFYVNTGDNLNILVEATDPDGDSLTYVAVDLPGGSSFNTSTQYFTWVPSVSGEYTVTFKATDSKGAYKYNTILLIVNRKPIFNSIGEQYIKEDSLLTFSLSAEDKDGDSLVYSLIDELPTDASITITDTGITFNWKPPIGITPPNVFAVSFKVEDYRNRKKIGGEDYKTVKINVEPFDGNFSPEIIPISDKTIKEGKTTMFPVVAYDRNEDDVLTYHTGMPLPEGSEFDSLNTRIFSWTPGYDQEGIYNLLFIVYDQEGKSASDSVKITVLDSNRAPVFNVTLDETLKEGDTVIVDFGISDPDGDDISITGTNLPEGASIDSSLGFKFIWYVDYSQAGSYSMKFIAKDEKGAQTELEYDVTVENVNRSPELPYVIYPANGEELTLENHLVWTKAKDPDTDDKIKYRIEIDDHPLFLSIVLWDTLSESRLETIDIISKPSSSLSKTTGGETYSIKLNHLEDISALKEDTLYYWRVFAFDDKGDTTGYSPGENSFYLNLQNNPPNAPASEFDPDINEVETSTTPIISWHPAEDSDASDDYSKLYYILQLDDNQFISGHRYEYTSETGVSHIKVTTALTDNKQWYYRVKTVDSKGESSTFSYIIPFFVNTVNEKPAEFSLASPVNKTEFNGETDSLSFSWEGTTDPDPEDSFTYTFMISSDTSFDEQSVCYKRENIPDNQTSHNVSKDLFSNGTYFWQVIASDSYGLQTKSSAYRSFTVLITGIGDDETEVNLDNFVLWSNYPNPFNAETIIKYNVPQPSYVTLDIYNVLGQKITSLVNRKHNRGIHSVKWNGKDINGNSVASGIYIYILKTKNFKLSRKMIYMK